MESIMKAEEPAVCSAPVNRVSGLKFRGSLGVVYESTIRFPGVRARSVLAALAIVSMSLLAAWPACADVAPYFVKVPQDSAFQTFQDFIGDFPTAQLFLVGGCVIAVMEAIFFFGLVRARKRHGDK